MHFPLNCLKPAPSAFHFVEMYYFVEILCENETIKSKNDWNIKRSHRLNKYMLKVAIQTLEEGEKYVQS